MTRRNFSPKTKAAIRARSGGVCEVHRIPEEARKLRYTLLPLKCKRPAEEADHIQCDWAKGDPTVENGADLCKPCHAIKTRIDKKESAKSARLRGETGQAKRRAARKASGTHRPIPSRGFQQRAGPSALSKDSEHYQRARAKGKRDDNAGTIRKHTNA